MAIAAIAGIASALGAAAAQIGAAGFFATLFSAAGATAFAIGAGLSMVSRALAPKPDLGAQLQGITQTTREPAGPRQLVYGQMRVGGQVVFLSHSGTDNKYLHMAIAFASHEIESYEEIWFNDNRIWTLSGGFVGDWGTYVTIDRKFGTAGQAASTDLVNANVRWTTNHKLSGIAYIAFRLEWNQDKFPQGVPNITTVLKGRKVYDPRTSTTAYSQNPALCIRDYLLDSKYGLGESSSLIDDASVIAAANICDEDVSLDGGGTQDRYQCNGVVNTANQIKGNIEQILSAMGGKLAYSGGKYFIDAAGYVAPTIEFTEADCTTDVQTQTRQSRRSAYNGVKGIFVSEEKEYKVLDYPAQISSAYATEDGDPIYLDMALPFVTNNTQAQRLAKIALLKSRQQVVITMSVNLKGLQVKIGDTVKVTNARLGYDEKVFEVIDYSLAITEGNLGVNLTLIETAAAIYDWATSDEQDFLSGGVLDLYDGRTVDNVTNLAKNEIALIGPDGATTTTTELTWTAPDDAFVDFYKVRYNVNGTTNYFHMETKETRILLSGLNVSSNYDFRVQVQNLLGVTSTGTSLTNQSFAGDSNAPAPVTGVTFTRGLKNITLEWTNPTDIDLAYVQIYISSTITKPASPSAQVRGTEYVYPAAGGEGKGTIKYFWLEAVDYSGNVSTTVGPEYEIILLPKSEEIDGDVSEALSINVFKYPYHNVPASSPNTFAEFSIPAPENGVTKYASLSGKIKYIPSTSLDDCILVVEFQRKSKGATSGASLGNVVASGTTGVPYTHYLEISGNHTKEVDVYGGIAASQTSPSFITSAKSVEYLGSTDRTKIIYGGNSPSTPNFTSGEMFYNDDRWTSSGTWLGDAAGAQRYPIPDLGSVSATLTLSLNQALAKSDSEEDYRVRVYTLAVSTGSLNLSEIQSQVFLLK